VLSSGAIYDVEVGDAGDEERDEAGSDGVEEVRAQVRVRMEDAVGETRAWAGEWIRGVAVEAGMRVCERVLGDNAVVGAGDLMSDVAVERERGDDAVEDVHRWCAVASIALSDKTRWCKYVSRSM
jgi:hypothetical protein